MSEKESHTFDDLIQQINQTARDIQREKGTLFEKLVLSYLRNEPTYERLYKMYGHSLFSTLEFSKC